MFQWTPPEDARQSGVEVIQDSPTEMVLELPIRSAEEQAERGRNEFPEVQCWDETVLLRTD